MKNILKKILKALAAAASCAAACFAFLFFYNKKKLKQKIENAKIKAQKEKEAAYEKIKESNSGALVDNACNANELHAITDDIKEQTAGAIQNRISEAGL